MPYTNVTDSPLNQLLSSIEERLKLAKNNKEFKADKTELAKETASQINKLLKLIDQLRSVMGIYNQGSGPGLTDILVIPKLISLKSSTKDYTSPTYKLYRFLKKNLANIIQIAVAQSLREIPQNEQDLAGTINELKIQIKANLLKNTTVQSFGVETIIEDLLKNINFPFLTLNYIRNKNNLISDITQTFLKNFKHLYLNSLLQRYAFQIKHPIMFDIVADVSQLLSTVPKDDLQKLVSFLNPMAIEDTSKLLGKLIIHQGNFVFKDGETKELLDINGLYKQYAPQSYQLIDITIANYFSDFAETPKVKSEKAKAELIQETISYLVQDFKTKLSEITLQIRGLTVDGPIQSENPKKSLFNLVDKFRQLEKLDLLAHEHLIQSKNDLITRLKSKTLLSEVTKESQGQLASLFVKYQRLGFAALSMQPELLTTKFVNTGSITHLTTVKEYIDNIFKSFQTEIEQPLNQTQKEIVAQMNELWRKWIEEERQEHLKATTAISASCKEIKTQAEQIRFEIGILPDPLELKLDYVAKKFIELDSKNQVVQTLHQELDLQERNLKEHSVNATISEDLVALFGTKIQKEFQQLYEAEHDQLVKIKAVIKQIEKTLIEQDSMLKQLDEKLQFERKMSEGNVNELRDILENKLHSLNELHKNFKPGNLLKKQEELKSPQIIKPKDRINSLQKRVGDNILDFKESLADFSKSLAILAKNITIEKRGEVIEVLEQLADTDRLAVIKYIETLEQIYEDDIKNEGLTELDKIATWIDTKLIPSAKRDLPLSQIGGLFAETKAFNNPHIKKLFFDIVCPDVEVNDPNHWKEFYQRLKKIFNPSIFQSESTKVNNALKLERLKKLAADTHKILSIVNPVKEIISKLKNIDKEITEDNVNIATLQQELQFQEEIKVVEKKEKELFTLQQEIQILDKLITLSEEIQLLGSEINDLKNKLDDSPDLIENLKSKQAAVEGFQVSLKVISKELQELNLLLKLVDSKSYQAKFKQLNNLCLVLQNNLTELQNFYHKKIVNLFDTEINKVQIAKDNFNQLVKIYQQNSEPNFAGFNTLLNKLKDIEKAVRKIDEQMKPIKFSLQEKLDAITADSTELTMSLVKKLQNQIQSLINQAKENSDRVTINIIDVHREDINENYRQDLEKANLFIKRASSEITKLKTFLSEDKLAVRQEILRSIEDTEQSSNRVKNELAIKEGCTFSALSRIATRMILASHFKQELDDYLVNRTKKFSVKDTLLWHDSQARMLFINGSPTKEGLKNALDNYVNDGNSQKLIKFINTNKSNFPGQHLQPLLNRLILAVRDYDKTLPIDYSDDFSSEIYAPAVNLRNASSVLKRLFNNNETKDLALGIKSLYTNIEGMHKYGIDINDAEYLKGNKINPGQTALDLASRLKNSLDEFMVKNEDELIKGGIVRKQLLLSFHEQFKTLLHSEDDKLSKHREAWKPIVANTALNIFSLIKLTVSKIKTHQATFFFQQTKRMQKVDAVEHALDSVVQNNLSLKVF
ncbi:Ankyrin repeat protein [Legionella busanensis]|uniref:Ankyrin repeat protein n=1 Tax=Legionella busanensis TaxID=190655 RepID=A0A378JKK7_9GAMM|nr:hypothetical protein [Legionella busanensis]STX51714.1 Ankyrin repeat protein [Legionella busanensis]